MYKIQEGKLIPNDQYQTLEGSIVLQMNPPGEESARCPKLDLDFGSKRESRSNVFML